MSAISRLIVVHSDPRVAEAVRFGFEREGAQVVCVARAGTIASAVLEGQRNGLQARPDLVVAGAGSAAATTALLAALRDELRAAGMSTPILCVGQGLDRPQALAAGACELVPQPAFVRDVVTVGRLVAAGPGSPGAKVNGQLSDYGGVFHLVRAMAATRRSAVLSLVRGLRRGELRFYQGEVTSAQVSVLHGLAALHQLLLWTRAHFELREEDVVRRRQIPLALDEILADAERFLIEIRAVASTLVPTAVYEIDRDLMQAHRSAIPRPVRRVLRLIDGHRSMGDVIEDSPYRVLETVRITNRLVETGLIRSKEAGRPEDVSIERWLADQYAELSSATIGSMELEPMGGRVRPPFADDDEDLDEEEMADGGAAAGEGGGRRPFGRASSRPPPTSVDEWADVLPTEMVTGFSPVVPATEAAGEIVSAAAPSPLLDARRAAESRRNGEDAPATRPPSLWRRLFSKPRDGEAGDDPGEPGQGSD